MEPSSTRFETDHPCWAGYRPGIERLGGLAPAPPGRLNALLPAGTVNENGLPIRFVDSRQLDSQGYEHRIYTRGEVSTRPGSWHDLFNALVWMRLPLTKRAMNALHYRALPQQADGRRGALRDALTLFDECGVVVLSDRPDLLKALAAREWRAFFTAPRFHRHVSVVIVGHAMLEKCLSPYKAMTANALLVEIGTPDLALPRERMLRLLDERLAALLLGHGALSRPGRLAPLPLAGLPGWWPFQAQDEDFYGDPGVFRPASPDHVPAPVVRLGKATGTRDQARL